MTIFRVKSVKIYAGQKKFTWIYLWCSWQIWGIPHRGGPPLPLYKWIIFAWPPPPLAFDLFRDCPPTLPAEARLWQITEARNQKRFQLTLTQEDSSLWDRLCLASVVRRVAATTVNVSLSFHSLDVLPLPCFRAQNMMGSRSTAFLKMLSNESLKDD